MAIGRRKGSKFGPVNVLRSSAMCAMKEEGMSSLDIGKKFGVSRSQVTNNIAEFREYYREHRELVVDLTSERCSLETRMRAAEVLLRLHMQLTDYSKDLAKSLAAETNEIQKEGAENENYR